MPASAHLTPTTTPTYITLQEAVSRGYGAYSTLRSWIYDGRLPAVKIGGRVRVTLEDLEALAVRKPTMTARPDDEVCAAVARVVAVAPRLTGVQRELLAAIVGGAR